MIFILWNCKHLTMQISAQSREAKRYCSHLGYGFPTGHEASLEQATCCSTGSGATYPLNTSQNSRMSRFSPAVLIFSALQHLLIRALRSFWYPLNHKQNGPWPTGNKISPSIRSFSTPGAFSEATNTIKGFTIMSYCIMSLKRLFLPTR